MVEMHKPPNFKVIDNICVGPLALHRRCRHERQDSAKVVESLEGRAVKLHLLDLGGDVAGVGMSKLFLTIAAAFADAMPRGDALTCSDVRVPTLAIFRAPCGRRGRYAICKAHQSSTATR